MSMAPSMAPGAAPKSGVSFRDREGNAARGAVGESLEKRWRPGTLGPSVPTDGGWEISAMRPDRGRARRPADRDTGFPDGRAACCSPTSCASRDRVCSRAELIDALWPEAPPAAADTALSALLSKLRRTLGDGRGRRARRAPAGTRARRRRRRRPRGGRGRRPPRPRCERRRLGRRRWPTARAASGVDGCELPARTATARWLPSSGASSTTIRLRGARGARRGRACARAGASSARPSRRRGRRSRRRRSASRRTGC